MKEIMDQETIRKQKLLTKLKKRTAEDKQFDIIIAHVPTWDTKKEDSETPYSVIRFRPFLTNFSDNFKSNWKTQSVLGRMDNIATFERTTRVISIDFAVPSASEKEAEANHYDCRLLATFLYPVYKTIKKDKAQVNEVPNELGNTNLKPTISNLYKAARLATTLEQQLDVRENTSVMSSPPILKIQFANFISDQYGEGLYGYIDGYNYKPDNDAGFYVDKKLGMLIPKVINVSLTFNVIHTHPLGWDTDNEPRSLL